ncbi:MAG: transcriptional regulator [Planctomycetota bacterium]|nr:transcriptional regulator [Planctomycetota bacterium]
MDEGLRDMANVDRLIHEPSRLVIVTILYLVERADFLYLLGETEMTKGNLSSHLAKLEVGGYVEEGLSRREIQKTYRGKVPQTICRLTTTGRAAFRTYRASLGRAVYSMHLSRRQRPPES